MENRSEDNKDKNANNLSVRAYLDQNVMPLVLKGLVEVSNQRPANPIEFLANYLHENNPEKKSAANN